MIDWKTLEVETSSAFVEKIQRQIAECENHPEVKVSVEVRVSEHFIVVYLVPRRYMSNFISNRNSYLYSWDIEKEDFDVDFYTPHDIECFAKMMGFTQEEGDENARHSIRKAGGLLCSF